MGDKMYLLDLFGPYLDEMTSQVKLSAERVYGAGKPPEQSGDATFQNLQECTAHIKSESIATGVLRPNDPTIHLISNIIGSVPLSDTATRSLFLQILMFANGEHQKLFPNIRIPIKFIPELEEDCKYLSNGTTVYQLFVEIHNYAAPNMLTRLYRKPRAKYGRSFFCEVVCRRKIDSSIYNDMILCCIKTRNLSGIKDAKKDFLVHEGLIEPGSDLLLRITRWFVISLEAEYYEGLESVCNSWEKIHEEDKHLIYRVPPRSCDLLANIKMDWAQLAGKYCVKLCTNEGRAITLMKIYLYFALEEDGFNEVYNLFEFHYTTVLRDVLIDHLKNIVENLIHDLKNLLSKLGFVPTNILNTLLTYINYLDILVERSITLIKRHNEFDSGTSRAFNELKMGLLDDKDILKKLSDDI